MRIALGIFILLCVGLAVGYRSVVEGGLSARQTPSTIETSVAHWLVDMSIPQAVKAQKNPLDASANSGEVTAGRALYQKNCEACHGYDGTGNTAAGGGLYPPPPSLHRAAIVKRQRTDGELFYLIRNGIRNTGMPGWQLPDQQTWQLVAFIRNLPITVALDTQSPDPRKIVSPSSAHYVGSASCNACHVDIYARRSKTAMANVVRDPKKHPEVVIPDFSKADPPLTFTVDDVALVYGSIWKQRYFKKVGDDYYPFPVQWDVTHKKWKPYVVKDDWWVKFY
ncbi:MAG: cytochrome c, partial [Verrucomicrobia bacterium]|nr:cytochrome c [Verrucomicrobiota bacterium]